MQIRMMAESRNLNGSECRQGSCGDQEGYRFITGGYRRGQRRADSMFPWLTSEPVSGTPSVRWFRGR